jgi:hypothetical protein
MRRNATFFDADERGDALLLEWPHQRSVGIERASRLSKRFSVGMTCRIGGRRRLRALRSQSFLR